MRTSTQRRRRLVIDLRSRSPLEVRTRRRAPESGQTDSTLMPALHLPFRPAADLPGVKARAAWGRSARAEAASSAGADPSVEHRRTRDEGKKLAGRASGPAGGLTPTAGRNPSPGRGGTLSRCTDCGVRQGVVLDGPATLCGACALRRQREARAAVGKRRRGPEALLIALACVSFTVAMFDVFYGEAERDQRDEANGWSFYRVGVRSVRAKPVEGGWLLMTDESMTFVPGDANPMEAR